MAYKDRKDTIFEIKNELKKLENEFLNLENVPDERKIKLVSTSLVEAGVDFDFYTVFREVSGLDSILQAGGRCNREGKRKNALTNIFKFEGGNYIDCDDNKLSITIPMLEKYDDISSKESVNFYYDQLYFSNAKKIKQKSISEVCKEVKLIDLKDYAEEFKFIKNKIYSVVLAQDNESKDLINRFRKEKNIKILRKLQKYAFSIYENELKILQNQGVIENIDGLLVLTNNDYYSSKTGILFEPTDYII